MWVVLEVGGLDAHWDLQPRAVVNKQQQTGGNDVGCARGGWAGCALGPAARSSGRTNSSRQAAMMWVVLEVGGLDAHWDLQPTAVIEQTAADRRQ
jgi:hypothetical protein